MVVWIGSMFSTLRQQQCIFTRLKRLKEKQLSSFLGAVLFSWLKFSQLSGTQNSKKNFPISTANTNGQTQKPKNKRNRKNIQSTCMMVKKVYIKEQEIIISIYHCWNNGWVFYKISFVMMVSTTVYNLKGESIIFVLRNHQSFEVEIINENIC